MPVSTHPVSSVQLRKMLKLTALYIRCSRKYLLPPLPPFSSPLSLPLFFSLSLFLSSISSPSLLRFSLHLSPSFLPSVLPSFLQLYYQTCQGVFCFIDLFKEHIDDFLDHVFCVFTLLFHYSVCTCDFVLLCC